MEFRIARKNMVNCQLKPNKVNNNEIINAFLEVPREIFLKKEHVKHAYLDENLNISKDRVLLNPVTYGRLIQSLEIKKNETVLNIASGIGYGVVIISYLANTVLGIESDKKLVEDSTNILLNLNVNNAAIIKGNFNEGFSKQAPYDAILIEGAVEKVPDKILNQLSDRGRLATVESSKGGYGQAVLYERINNNFIKNVLFDTYLPILNAFKLKKNDFEF